MKAIKTITLARMMTAWLGFVAATGLVQADLLFEEESVLALAMTGPFKAMLRDKDNHSPRHFMLAHNGIVHNIEARLHGFSRLQVCKIPPMLLHFDTSPQEAARFTTAKALRLVTSCRHTNRGEQDLLEEYAAHKIWNVLTEDGYRVRLARVTYADPDSGSRRYPFTRFAFLLEPHEQFEQRVGATRVMLPYVFKSKLDAGHSALVYVFQYLIGNTDWHVVTAGRESACCHNGSLFERNEKLLFVPYDFDITGLVNTPYANQHRDPATRSITERRYRGLCTDRGVLRAALEKVRMKESEIMAVLQNTPGLTARNRSRATRYLGEFFKLANDPDTLLHDFEKECR